MPSMGCRDLFQNHGSLEREIEIEKNQLIIARSQSKPKLNLVGGFYQDKLPYANSEANLQKQHNYWFENWAIWDSSKAKVKRVHL